MLKKFKVSDVVTIIVLVIFVTLFIYYYVNTLERNKLIDKLYPIQAFFELSAMNCSDGAPQELKNILKKATYALQAPNNQIAYIDSSGKIFYCASGYLGLPLFSEQVTSNTRFRYASVTKLWTSDAILDLVKDHKIHLKDQILNLLTQVPEPHDIRVKRITVENLLLHRGGFSRTGLMGDIMFKSGEIPFCPSHLEKLVSIELKSEPNTEFNYSNLGYCILGEVIVNDVQRPYQSYINEKYKLDDYDIKFIGNYKYNDEANYRVIQTALMDISDIYTAFDYPSLASSAGLSGSAISLAKQVKLMIHKPIPNILSTPNMFCNLSIMKDCVGYAMYEYQYNKMSSKIYFRDGALPGMSSLVVVNENGKIVTLLSSGQAKKGVKNRNEEIRMEVFDFLDKN